MTQTILQLGHCELLKLPSLVCHLTTAKNSLASISEWTLKSHIRALLPATPAHEHFESTSSTVAHIEYYFNDASFVTASQKLDGKKIFISDIEVTLSLLPPAAPQYDGERHTVILRQVPGKLLQLNIATSSIPETHLLWSEIESTLGSLKALDAKVSSMSHELSLYVDIYMKFSKKANLQKIHHTLMRPHSRLLLQRDNKAYLIIVEYDTTDYMSKSALHHRQQQQQQRLDRIADIVYWRDATTRLLDHMITDTSAAWELYLCSSDGADMRKCLQHTMELKRTALRQLEPLIESRDVRTALTPVIKASENSYYELLDLNSKVQYSVSEFNEQVALAQRREQEAELQKVFDESHSSLHRTVHAASQRIQAVAAIECPISSSVGIMLRQLASHVSVATKLLAKKQVPIAALQTSQQMIEIEVSKLQPQWKRIVAYCEMAKAIADFSCRFGALSAPENSSLVSDVLSIFATNRLQELLHAISDAFSIAVDDMSSLLRSPLDLHGCMLQWLQRVHELFSLCRSIEHESSRLAAVAHPTIVQTKVDIAVTEAAEEMRKVEAAVSHRWDVLISSGDNDWDYSMLRRLIRILDNTLMHMYATWEIVEMHQMSVEDQASVSIRKKEQQEKQQERKREIEEVYWMTVEDKRALVLRKIERLLQRKAELAATVEREVVTHGNDEPSPPVGFRDRWYVDQVATHINWHSDAYATSTLKSIVGHATPSRSENRNTEKHLRQKLQSKKRPRLVYYC